MSIGDDEKSNGASRANESRLKSFSLGNQLDSLEESLDLEQKRVWPHLGVALSEFPILSESLDGFRNCLYVIAGASRMGKTAFALELLVDLLRNDEEARGIFVTLEQSVRDLNVRLVGQCGEVNLEYLLNPSKEGAQKYEERKNLGLERAHQLKGRLSIVDESLGALRFDDVKSFVEELRRETSGPLFLVVDPLFKLRASLSETLSYERESSILIRELKTLCMAYDLGVIVTTGVDGAAGKTRPQLTELESQSALLYDAQVIMLLYCDYFNNAETTFLEWEWGSDDLMVPIFELNVAKNKMGAFAGRLYFRFYHSFSKFKECVRLEIDNYEKMLYNLRVHDESDPMIDEQILSRFENIDRQK